MPRFVIGPPGVSARMVRQTPGLSAKPMSAEKLPSTWATRPSVPPSRSRLRARLAAWRPPRVGDRRRERFVHERVLAGAGGDHHLLGVERVRGADEHALDLAIGKDRL